MRKAVGIERMKDWAAQDFPEVGPTLVPEFISDARALFAEYERLRRVEEDHINVLKAALYCETGGIDLVHRLTTYAINQRPAAHVNK